jgi:hypothetical protein
VGVDRRERLRAHLPRRLRVDRLAREDQVQLPRSAEDQHVGRGFTERIPELGERLEGVDQVRQRRRQCVEVVGLDDEVPVRELRRRPGGAGAGELDPADGRVPPKQLRDAGAEIHRP